MSKIIEKIKQFIKLFQVSSYDKCYNRMESRGDAVFDSCCGVCGGDSTTDYLNYDCIGCPYLTKAKTMKLEDK